MSNMLLVGRQAEPRILRSAVQKLGVTHFFEPPDEVHIEGGDVIPVIHNNKRTLFLGIGARTNHEAAVWIAKTLIPQGIIDEVIGLKHDGALLHLDTCFTILPNQTIFCARGSLMSGFFIDKDQKVKSLEPLDYFKSLNYSVIFASQSSALQDQTCNVLHLDKNQYLSFKLPRELSHKIEEIANVKLHQLDGSEIAKAKGGLHCLTRPIY